MKEVFFFSNNQNKISEISNLFLNSPFVILSLNNFEKIVSPDETGTTFKENAKIKSLFGLKKFNRICLSDDSGICIDALNGGPGVNSKKYLESNGDKNIILQKIISKTKVQNNFKAYFQTTICLSLNKKRSIFFTGKIKGRISKKIKGGRGFGYDPIFIPAGSNLTFAEMKIKEKNLLSHRAIAIGKLKKYLVSLI